MSRPLISGIILIACFSYSTAQMMSFDPRDGIDIAGLDAGYLPDIGGHSVTNYGANLNFMKPLSTWMIGFGVNYEYLQFDFDESDINTDLSTYEQIHSIRTNFFIRKPLKNNWSIMISVGPNLMSTLDDGIGSEDIIVNTLGAVSKRWGDFNKNTTLMIGVLYGSQLGRPTIIPTINLRRKVNEKLSFSIGIPMTGIDYRIDDKNRLSLSMRPQGVYANNPNPVLVENGEVLENTKLRFNGFNAELSYRRKLSKNISAVAAGGFVPAPILTIEDSANNELLDLNADAGAFFRIGLRFSVSPKMGFGN
ncbi:DUF6268 family outer membrane beta-barrel protein [Ekhidna sp.]